MSEEPAVSVRMVADWVAKHLAEYIAIHEEVFKKSLRIAYAEHRGNLTRIAEDLEGIDGLALIKLGGTPSSREHEFLEHLRRYLAALIRAVRGLADICTRLETEASGSKTGSVWSFRNDVKRYEADAQEYAKLGQRLMLLYGRL